MAKQLQNRRDIVVDRCWSLAPLSALSALLAMLISKNGALFYVAFIDQFGVSHQSASWPLTLNMVMAHVAGLLVTLLQERFTIYQIAVSGSLLNFAALVASAFVPDMTWMCFTLGFISGLAVGMIMLSLSIYNMLYFDKYRATASGFKYTGMTLAPLAFPLVLSALVREYGLHGALLLLSAITVNTLPIAMLMNKPRPVTLCCGRRNVEPAEGGCNSCSKGSSCGVVTKGTAMAALSNCASKGGDKFEKNFRKDQSNLSNDVILLAQNNNTSYSMCTRGCAVNGVEDVVRTEGEICHENGVTCYPGKYGPESAIDVKLPKSEAQAQMHATRSCEEGCKSSKVAQGETCLEAKASGSVWNSILMLLRNPVLYVLVITFTIGEYTTITFETTVLDYAADRGATRRQAEPIITYVATAEMLGRLVIPFFWDRARLSRYLLVALCLLVEAFCLIGMPHATSFSQVVATAVVTGIPAGCIVALKPVVLSDHFGVERLAVCWGMAGIAMLPVAFGGPLLIGVFRDTLGSYENLYRMLSAMCVTCAVAFFVLDSRRTRSQRRRNMAQGSPCGPPRFRARSFDSEVDVRDIY
ncbi:monocarboxylate transporter 9-like [Dermacentor albipictus]|uniref:monocarboxylate transporter 9-like n=1 Tax=Dermacentor albipictus TaxID=60249 RepID=UPI0031FD0001